MMQSPLDEAGMGKARACSKRPQRPSVGLARRVHQCDDGARISLGEAPMNQHVSPPGPTVIRNQEDAFVVLPCAQVDAINCMKDPFAGWFWKLK
jgi:hypothetical protein